MQINSVNSVDMRKCHGIPSLGNSRMVRAKGQAVVEFLVFSVALIPLFLLVPMIAKYQDIAHSTQMASRYVAFEATTRNDSSGTFKPVNQLADEVRQRFFSNPDAPIKTNDSAGNFKANQNLFWRDPNDKSLIADINSDVTVTFGSSNGSDHSAAFSAAEDGRPFLLNNALSLRSRGIYTANVSVKVANLPAGLKFYEPFDQINLTMTRSTSVVIDGWAGSDPNAVQRKLDNPILSPATSLRPLQPFVDIGIRLTENASPVRAPQLGQLDFWQDVVPADRLRRR